MIATFKLKFWTWACKTQLNLGRWFNGKMIQNALHCLEYTHNIHKQLIAKQRKANERN